MKIRTDFVTNSSSSSYCSIHIKTDNDRYDENESYNGHSSFFFHDPTEKLGQFKSASELFDIICYSLESYPGGNPGYRERLQAWIDDLDDISTLRSIEIGCHEEAYAEWGWNFSPRDVRYRYDFTTGEKSIDADVHWHYYGGLGDPLAPDFRTLDGEPVDFNFYQYAKGYFAIDYHGKGKEAVLPARILEDGTEYVVKGIGPKCFVGATGMETLVLPPTLTYVAPDAFDSNKRNLQSIRIEGHDASETTFLRDGSKLLLTASPEEEVTVPEDITELGESAFAACPKLLRIVLHDGMKKPSMSSLQSGGSISFVVLTDGSVIDISSKDAMRCFTASRGVIRYNYKKRAELMLQNGDAARFKRAVEGGSLAAEDLEGFYEKIKRKRRPEFKEMKEFILERLGATRSARSKSARK